MGIFRKSQEEICYQSMKVIDSIENGSWIKRPTVRQMVIMLQYLEKKISIVDDLAKMNAEDIKFIEKDLERIDK